MNVAYVKNKQIKEAVEKQCDINGKINAFLAHSNYPVLVVKQDTFLLFIDGMNKIKLNFGNPLGFEYKGGKTVNRSINSFYVKWKSLVVGMTDPLQQLKGFDLAVCDLEKDLFLHAYKQADALMVVDENSNNVNVQLVE